MNVRLFRQMWRRNWIRVLVIAAGVMLWAFLAPIIYSNILSNATILQNLPKQFTHFGSGNLASLPGTITLLFEHPFLIAMMSVVALGTTIPAIAGQRQRGTLELLLARPVRRTTFVGTVIVATATMLGLVLVMMMLGLVLGGIVSGTSSMLPVEKLPLVWLNAFLLFGCFAAFGIAASAANNRSSPALALAIAYLLINYFVEILGSLWSPAEGYQPLSLFHHFQTTQIFAGTPSVADFLILGGVLLVPLVFALVWFPRRDIPAPD